MLSPTAYLYLSLSFTSITLGACVPVMDSTAALNRADAVLRELDEVQS